VVKSNGTHSLLKIKIDAGKFHQIRSQLSLAGFPILGDVKYKGPHWSDKKSIALCATGLSFKKTTDAKIIDLIINIPEEWGQYIKQ